MYITLFLQNNFSKWVNRFETNSRKTEFVSEKHFVPSGFFQILLTSLPTLTHVSSQLVPQMLQVQSSNADLLLLIISEQTIATHRTIFFNMHFQTLEQNLKQQTFLSEALFYDPLEITKNKQTSNMKRTTRTTQKTKIFIL